MPKTDDEIQKIREQIATQRAQVDQLLADYHAQHSDLSIVLFDPQESRPSRGVQIAPFTGKGGGVRVSYFDENGFSGHTIYEDEHEAVIHYHDWTPDPDRLDRLVLTARFIAGTGYSIALENMRLWHDLHHTPREEAWQAETQLRARYYPPAPEKDTV
jgi:hypothetical protein